MKNWTGERLETSIYMESTLEHLHRYGVVSELIKNKTVLDIASGEGYGTNLMAENAKEIIGVDIAKSVVVAASEKYKKPNLRYLEGSASKIPCGDKYFDVVISYETIEHHDKHQEMMLEIKRVLKPEGVLIISSPDKLNYTDKVNHHNEHHVKELYEQEFKDLLKSHFKNTSFYNQRSSFVSMLVPEDDVNGFKEYRGNFEKVYETNDFAQLYIIGIASDFSIPSLPLSVFTDDNFLRNTISMNAVKLQNTITYRIGSFLLSPIKMAKRIFKG